MNRIVTTFAVCGLLSFVCAIAFSANEGAENPTMLSHLAVGQRIRLVPSPSGGYDVHVFNQRYKGAIQEHDSDGAPERIEGVGRDFIVVDMGRRVTKVVAIHAIDTVTMASAEQGSSANGEAASGAEK